MSCPGPSANPRCPTNSCPTKIKHISRSLFQDIERGEDGEAGDPPIRVDQQTLRVWADGRPHRVNIPLKYQVCRYVGSEDNTNPFEGRIRAVWERRGAEGEPGAGLGVWVQGEGQQGQPGQAAHWGGQYDGQLGSG